MAAIPEGCVDLVVTDPPYFCPATHYQSRKGWQRQWSDMTIMIHWWSSICDAIKPNMRLSGHVLTFCNADSFAAFYPAMYSRWKSLVCVVWDKERPGLGRIWRHQHELIIAARNENAYKPNDGKLRPDVIRCKATPSGEREHPVEKPPEMLEELITATTPQESFILDPFLGSGTTAVAAKRLGRQYIGIEIEEKYCEIAVKRLAQRELFAETG